MVAIKVITAPTVEPLDLADLKNDIRVDTDLTQDDNLIAGHLTAARRWLENAVRRALITQTLELWLDDWPAGDRIQLPRPPLQSVTHIKYYDVDDNESTLNAATYLVDTNSEPGRVVLNDGESWPDTTLRPANGVVVRFVAGYGTSGTDVPAEYRHAIRFLVAHWYENREAVITGGGQPKEVPFGVESLIWPDRVW